MKVIEKCVPDVEFNFQEHLLGGVSLTSSTSITNILHVTRSREYGGL